jgi:hypothetical protein
LTLSRLAKWFGTGETEAGPQSDCWPVATWKIAEVDDWPPVEVLGKDFDWARRTGTGFVAQFNEKTWFLFHRDWFGWPDPPEWSLASYNAADGWRFYKDFDVLPENWSVPETQNAQN